MRADSPRLRHLAAQKVASQVATTLRLGRNQEGMLASFLQHDGDGVSWVWGKPHINARTQASLARRGLIVPNADGSYRPNDDLQRQYQRTLPTIIDDSI